jgi:hypothetical protein
MSGRRKTPRSAWPVLLMAGLAGGGHALAEEDADDADLEFLEYLGSWEDSEEDWLIFAGVQEADDEKKDDEKEETAPDGEKLAEVKDEQ